MRSSARTEARKLLGSALDRTLWAGNQNVRSTWGRLVFDLLAEAGGALEPLAARRDPLGANVADAVESLLNVASLLAESALGEAIVGSGEPGRIALAQDALEASAFARPAAAIEELGKTWRESQLALR